MSIGYICKPANEIGVMLGSPEDLLKDKAKFIANLAALLRQTREGIADLALSEDGETVTIVFKSGATRRVNIACDCYLAIIKDVTKKI